MTVGDNLPEKMVTAAAMAVRDAHEVDVGIPASVRPMLPATDWEPEARAAVAAALRVMSKTLMDDGRAMIGTPTIGRMAAQVEHPTEDGQQ